MKSATRSDRANSAWALMGRMTKGKGGSFIISLDLRIGIGQHSPSAAEHDESEIMKRTPYVPLVSLSLVSWDRPIEADHRRNWNESQLRQLDFFREEPKQYLQ
jgi:hypothetical protein